MIVFMPNSASFFLFWIAMATFLLTSMPGHSQTTDLSTVTEKYVRNMKLLETMTPEADIRAQMAVVAAQADDLGRFFRSKGTAAKRRSLFEEEEAMKSKERLSKNDMEKLNKIREEIKALDPDNYFQRARPLYQSSVGELNKLLDLVQTTDPVRKDVLRLTRQHIETYNRVLQAY